MTPTPQSPATFLWHWTGECWKEHQSCIQDLKKWFNQSPTNQLSAQPQTSNPWCLVILFRAQAPHLQIGLFNIKLFFRCCCFCTANSCLCISWGQCMQAGGPKEKYWGSSNTSISKKAWVLRASGLVNTWRFRDSSMPKHSMKSPCPFPHTICLAACQGLAGPL